MRRPRQETVSVIYDLTTEKLGQMDIIIPEGTAGQVDSDQILAKSHHYFSYAFVQITRGGVTNDIPPLIKNA